MSTILFEAEPYPLRADIRSSALLMIDMQREFLCQGGIGDVYGNDVSLLQPLIEPCKKLLDVSRQIGLFVIHTREGHRKDLCDAAPSKLSRGKPEIRIGERGSMGRLMVRGELGHNIIPELYPLENEPIIDKPGHGAFYATDLLHILLNQRIKTLIVCGVTTEVCVHTTIREANDRGFECIVPADCVGSYFQEFQRVGLDMIKAQGGIFGWVSTSENIIAAIRKPVNTNE